MNNLPLIMEDTFRNEACRVIMAQERVKVTLKRMNKRILCLLKAVFCKDCLLKCY